MAQRLRSMNQTFEAIKSAPTNTIIIPTDGLNGLMSSVAVSSALNNGSTNTSKN